jgi:hypothetical protein
MFSAAILSNVPFLQMWNGDHMGDGWSWAGWLTMTLAMVLFWGVIAAVVVVFLRSANHEPYPHEPTPLDSRQGPLRSR